MYRYFPFHGVKDVRDNAVHTSHSLYDFIGAIQLMPAFSFTFGSK